MKSLLTRTALVIALLASASPAWADGTEFSGGCSTITWAANSEADLAGYELFDRTSLTAPAQLISTLGVQTSIACSQVGFNPGQHYLSLRAFDLTGNRGGFTAEIPFVIILDNQVSDLRVTALTATSATLTFTEVTGGAGSAADYDVRFATPLISWGSALSVTSGTCSTPMIGSGIGVSRDCTVTGLSTTTPYQFQLVPFRGTIGVDAIYGPLSNIANGTTGGTPPAADRTTTIIDDFNRANGTLATPWQVGYTGQQNPAINSNAVRPPAAGGADAIATYNTAMPNDQWAQALISTIQGAGTVSARVKLRYSAQPTNSGYECRANRNNASVRSEIAKRVSGAGTTLISENTTTWASGDTLDCEVQGSTIKLFRITGGTSTEILSWDDSTFTGGYVGISIAAATLGDGVLDNFAAGGFSAAAVTDPCGC